MSDQPSKRGGKRPGAGRPKRTNQVVNITINKADAEIAEMFRENVEASGVSQTVYFSKWVKRSHRKNK